MSERTTIHRLADIKEKGLGFEAHSVKLALADNGFHNIVFQTNGRPVEIAYHAGADGFFHIKAHLISSINVASANLGMLNHDFRKTNTGVASIAIVASYTVSSTFYEEIIGVAGAGASGGGGVHEEGFWIFDANKMYVFEAQNLSGAAGNFSWDMDFFEIV